MKRFLKLYGVEQKLFFRSADVFIFNLCMPLATLVMIALIAGGKAAGDSGMTYLQSAFASLVAVGICCSAFMSIPIVIVDYRDKKILKHFYCSPCSPAWILGAATSLVYFPMLFLSGATIPYELFPEGLQKVANIMPLTQGIKLMKAVSMGKDLPSAGSIVLLLLAITVICSIISIKTFRWE